MIAMVQQIYKGGFDSNFTYLLTSENGERAIIDPCGDCAAALEKENIPENDVRYILITHGHSDHFDALDKVKRLYPASRTAGFYQAEFPRDILLKDGDTLEFGGGVIKVLHTPGHSRDSVCYLWNCSLFTGDTVFVDCIGFCRSPKTMAQSLERILSLPGELVVYPGHDYGRVPFRALAEERAENPELAPEFISALYRG